MLTKHHTSFKPGVRTRLELHKEGNCTNVGVTGLQQLISFSIVHASTTKFVSATNYKRNVAVIVVWLLVPVTSLGCCAQMEENLCAHHARLSSQSQYKILQ